MLPNGQTSQVHECSSTSSSNIHASVNVYVRIWKTVESPKDLHQQIDNLSSLFMSTFHGWNFKNWLEHLFNTFFYVFSWVPDPDQEKGRLKIFIFTHNGEYVAENFVHFICHSSRVSIALLKFILIKIINWIDCIATLRANF